MAALRELKNVTFITGSANKLKEVKAILGINFPLKVCDMFDVLQFDKMIEYGWND